MTGINKVFTEVCVLFKKCRVEWTSVHCSKPYWTIWTLNQQTEPTLPTQSHNNLPLNVVQSQIVTSSMNLQSWYERKQSTGSLVCLPVTKSIIVLYERAHTQCSLWKFPNRGRGWGIKRRTIRTQGRRTQSDKPPYLCLYVTVRLMLSSASSRQTMILRYTLSNVTAVLSAVRGNYSWG